MLVAVERSLADDLLIDAPVMEEDECPKNGCTYSVCHVKLKF